MKTKKLTIEKFRILELTTLSSIKGGTGADSDTNITTNTMGSDNTTYTTDPNVQCPPDTNEDTTTDDPNTKTTTGGTGVPTLGTIVP